MGYENCKIPTTDDVRETYAEVFSIHEFNDWLAKHDAEVIENYKATKR
jgi:hypothetical protein